MAEQLKEPLEEKDCSQLSSQPNSRKAVPPSATQEPAEKVLTPYWNGHYREKVSQLFAPTGIDLQDLDLKSSKFSKVQEVNS
jgi:hypothetical protein